MPQDNRLRRTITLSDETLKVINQAIRKNSDVEAESRAKIEKWRRLLDETAEMIDGYRPSKT